LSFFDSFQAAEFFVTLFNIDEDGKVGPSDVGFFYRSIAEAPRGVAPDLEAYTSEVFDIYQCQRGGFGIRQLWESGQQQRIVQNMCDLALFEE
jgi:hypothetical protein